MRIIPKNTKIKLQFYKNIGIADVVLGLISLGFICLAITSNLQDKWIIALIILIIVCPLYIKIGDIRLYNSLGHFLKFIFAKKKYSKDYKGKKNISALSPNLKIEDNYIKQKDNSYSAVIEIPPIAFHLMDERKQNYLCDRVFSNIYKNISDYQEIEIVKLEKPLVLDKYIQNELIQIQNLIKANEVQELNEQELKKRLEIIENRINIIDIVNSKEKIYSNYFYFIIHDLDKTNLENTCNLIISLLQNNGFKTKQLNDLELFLFLKYSYSNDFDERDFYKILKKDYIKTALPNKVKFKISKTNQDNKTLSQLVITDYPLKVENGWCETLFNLPNTKVVLKAKPVERYKAIKRIDASINEILTQSSLGKSSYQLDKQTHLETLQNLLISIQNENEMFFDTTIIITVYDKLKQTTNKKQVKRKLKELGFKFSEMFGRQIDTYLTNQISKGDKIKTDRGLNSGIIASGFPFISDSFQDDKGILIGENNVPIFIDFFKRDDDRVNSNMIIIGKSGSGKSFATKTILTHLVSNNAKIFILDPENEYGNLANNLGGKSIDVANNKNGIINPFQIITTIEDDFGENNSFYSHLQFLEEFFKVVLQGASLDSLELLNKIIVELYKNKGITNDTKLSNLTAKDYPTFQELVGLIEEKQNNVKDNYTKKNLKILSNYLSKFQKGNRNSAIWNGYTTFNPKENFICFNFQKLIANKNGVIANAQMLLVLKWLENEVIKNREYNEINKADRKIIVAIDEAHIFIDEKFPIALDFMYQLAKRIRKYNGMQIVITQNVKDFVGSPEIARKASSIINVSQYSLIFSLAPNDINDLCLLYEKSGQINEVETENIINLPKGCGFLMISPQQRTNIRIIASEFVRKVFELK